MVRSSIDDREKIAYNSNDSNDYTNKSETNCSRLYKMNVLHLVASNAAS